MVRDQGEGGEAPSREEIEAPSLAEIMAELDIAEAEVTLKIVALSRAYEMPVSEVIQIVGESLPPGRTLGEYADELLTEVR